MSRILEISPKTVYDKIDFVHRQCLAFARVRETELAQKEVGRLYIATDRQDYIINWTDRRDRTNTALTAVGSADNRTGYVFGMHLNFDPAPDREAIEGEAIVVGDFAKTEPAFRRYARYWLEPDFKRAMQSDPRQEPPRLESALAAAEMAYRDMETLPEAEEAERIYPSDGLPERGMQVHFEYTTHAHFRLLRRLLPRGGKVRFFMDQDETLRAACISAFQQEIAEGRADAFYVQIAKELTVDDRREMVRRSKVLFNRIRKRIRRRLKQEWSDRKIRLFLVIRELRKLPIRLRARDVWTKIPGSTMAEPDKMVCHLTDRGDYGIERRATVYTRASLHAIDRYFMQLRRLLMALERPISTPSNQGKVWRGYSPYNPKQVQKLLDIYRVYYNYVKKGEDGRTPAMRIGAAKGVVRMEDILYFS